MGKVVLFLTIVTLSFSWVQREYEEFKVRINGLVATAQKVPEEGWTMQDGTPWPGNSVRDHPGMIQVGFSLNFCPHLYYQQKLVQTCS